MNHAFFAAGAVGIAPAFLIMFYALRRYEYPYVEEALFRNDRLFLSFSVGMVVGVLSAVLFNAFGVVGTLGAMTALLAVALFEESFKVAYLNLRFFQGRFDAVFYGPSLGLGTAATFSMAVAFQTFTAPGDPFAPLNVTILALLAVALCALHFFTGSVLGAGAGQGRTWRSYAQALGARVVFALLLAPFLAPFEVGSPGVLVAFLLAATGFTLFLLWEAQRFVIPDSLPPDVRRRLRRRPAGDEA